MWEKKAQRGRWWPRGEKTRFCTHVNGLPVEWNSGVLSFTTGLEPTPARKLRDDFAFICSLFPLCTYLVQLSFQNYMSPLRKQILCKSCCWVPLTDNYLLFKSIPFTPLKARTDEKYLFFKYSASYVFLPCTIIVIAFSTSFLYPHFSGQKIYRFVEFVTGAYVKYKTWTCCRYLMNVNFIPLLSVSLQT